MKTFFEAACAFFCFNFAVMRYTKKYFWCTFLLSVLRFLFSKISNENTFVITQLP